MKRLIIYSLIFVFISCKKDENGVCLKGTGENATEVRTIPDIKYLDASDRFEIVYHQDSTYKIELKGGKNLLPGIVTKVNGDSLILRNGNACDWYRNYKHKIYIHLHTPSLQQVRYSGSGTFRSELPIKGSKFVVETWDSGGDIFLTTDQIDTLLVANHAGTADFYINGTANKFYAYTGGNGFIHAQNLYSSDAFVNNSGTGQIKARAAIYFEIQVFYTGNVFYYGHPAGLDIREYDSGRALAGE